MVFKGGENMEEVKLVREEMYKRVQELIRQKALAVEELH